MDGNQIMQNVIHIATNVGLKILAAVVIYLIGRWLISMVINLLQRALTAQHVDPTIQRYLGNIVSVTLNIALVIALLGYFGVETTTFAALLAGAGLAIGAAWGGLLTNFAAGAFLVILRPYKVGDLVNAGGVNGTVKEIGLFSTTIETVDGVQTYVGNNKIFSDTILNYTESPYRRVDLVAQIHHKVDHREAMDRLKESIGKIPNVLSKPAVDVEILELNAGGPILAVRPCCKPEHYWQVYFDTNRTIRETFTAAGFPVPEQYSAQRVLD